MDKTIGNPLSWAASHLASTGSHIAASAEELGGEANVPVPEVAALTNDDIVDSLRDGWDDFLASRADAIFAILIYPVVGLLLIGLGLRMESAHLIFPLAAGFAILGPVAAVGLYEVSRRREAGEDVNWTHAFGVISSPAFGAILLLGLYLLGLFMLWMIAAHGIYAATLGPGAPASLGSFLSEVFATGAGWTMIVIGIAVGFVFALVALAISVASFPLLVDRHVGVPVAVVTSVRVFKRNPGVILTWGAIVALGLVLGSIPLLLGLIVVIPVLGHATWHLYRRAVV